MSFSFLKAFYAVVECMIVDVLLTSVMTERIVQSHCIKFFQKLGNNQTETIQKIQHSFGDQALSKLKQRNGLIASETVECQWRVRLLVCQATQVETRR